MRFRWQMAMVAVFAIAGVSFPTEQPMREARAALADGAGSMDELVDRFLGALARGDRAALERLRVTEDEYLRIVLPGNRAPGTPERMLSLRESDFAWSLLDTKSQYAEVALLDRFGGHHLRVRERTFVKGTREYAGFTAHEKLRLTLEDEAGTVKDLNTGSIAEVGGVYKFVSYIGD